MKKILLMTIVAGILTTTAFSQTLTTAPQDNKQTTTKTSATEWEKKLKDELKLTADQVTKWEAINKEYQPKLDAIMNSDMTDEAKKQQKKEIKKEKEAMFFQLLTPEQQSRYKVMMENKKKEAEKTKPAGS